MTKNLVTGKEHIIHDENSLKKHLLQTQYIYIYESFDKFGNWIKRKQKEIESGNRAQETILQIK